MIKENYYPYTIKVLIEEGNVYYYAVTPEVLNGVECHGTNQCAATLEGQVVNYADNIAYISQDIDDLIATKILIGNDMQYFLSISEADKISINRKSMSWNEINSICESDLKGVFSESSSTRMSALIGRLVR